MIRIGIMGTDNSHSIAFSRLFNRKDAPGGRLRGARVVSIFGLNKERNEEVAEKGSVPHIAKSAAEMVPEVDAAIVDFRHGDLHYRYARPFIEAGIPTFIDKPFAIKIPHCKKMIELARRKRVLITSFSTVRFGKDLEKFARSLKKIGKVRSCVITGPGSTKSEYGGIFFYGIHCVEIMLKLFGPRIKSVRAGEYSGSVVANVRYKDDMVVTLNILADAARTYQVAAFGTKGHEISEGRSFADYRQGMKLFLKMVKARKRPIPYPEMLMTIKVLNAMVRSITDKGREIAIR